MDMHFRSQGERLKHIRELCGLSRRKISDRYQLSEATLRSWELDISHISDRMMKKIIDFYRAEQLLVHMGWIRHGMPPAPVYLPNADLDAAQKNYKDYNVLQEDVDQFLSYNKNRLVMNVDCDIPTLFLNKSDVIGAEQLTHTSLDRYLQKLIIIKPHKTDFYLLRQLTKDTDNTYFAATLPFDGAGTHPLHPIQPEDDIGLVNWIRKAPT